MYYKALTHDLRPPINGGKPVGNGSLPFTLPPVALDASQSECAAGWNFCRDVKTTMRIAGFWPRGWPVRVFSVSPTPPVVERKDKCRAATIVLTGEVTQATKESAISDLSAEWFGADADFMAERQIAWFRALGRPYRDEQAIVDGLQRELQNRGLDWKLRRYDDAWDAWAAWDAWDAWAARAARAAWDARDALIVALAAKRGLVNPDYLTAGLIDAYANGLAVAIPTKKNTLGWAAAAKE